MCGDDVDWLDGREGFENSYPLNLASSLEAIGSNDRQWMYVQFPIPFNQQI